MKDTEIAEYKRQLQTLAIENEKLVNKLEQINSEWKEFQDEKQQVQSIGLQVGTNVVEAMPDAITVPAFISSSAVQKDENVQCG